MAINTVLQDEFGNSLSEVLVDLNGAIANNLPDIEDTSYSCVRFIDPYGDTIFNRYQAVVLLEEWDRITTGFNESDTALWTDIRNLIIQCKNEPHRYLRFMGD